MTPAERLDTIKVVIAGLSGMEPSHVYLHLMEFGFGAVGYDQWAQYGGTVQEWVVEMVRLGEDHKLRGLADYITRAAPLVDESSLPWRVGEFRLFLSHIAEQKTYVSALSADLAGFGIHGFVAHEHIEPGREWAEVIRAGLLTCDALVAVLHPNFHQSNWTDQEVGYVMGQGKFAVAVRAGVDPYGFLGFVQGIPAPPTRTAPEVAREILRVLCTEPRTAAAVRDALVNKLVHAWSFNQSNSIVDFLRQCPKLSKDQYERLRQAQRSNVEVSGAFNVPSLLDPLRADYEPTATTWSDDEPF